MAEDLTIDAGAPRQQAPLVGRRAGEVRPHRLRFAVAYLALAAVAGAAVGATILLFDRPAEAVGSSWSAWAPEGKESEFPKQIADYVSGRYRLPSGDPLVGVLAGPPKVQDVDVRAVAIRPPAADGDIEIVPTEDSLMYVLCGLGERCSIPGEPSQERHRLLRRQALELALYTFKYVDDTDSVIALLPPNLEAEAGTAVFFEKKDFDSELERPLQATLSRPEPAGVATIEPAEGLTIDRLTRPRLFEYEFQQAQEGSAIIVLAPLGVAAQR